MVLKFFRMQFHRLQESKSSFLLNMIGIIIVTITAMIIGLWIHECLLLKK